MYVLSYGCLLSSYKAFFHLHTWFFLSCVFLVVSNVSLYSIPHATNIALYPMMFPSIAWWNYELLFRYLYCILDIILLKLVFPFLLITSSELEGSASMMSLHSSYYSSSWIVVTCSSEQVSSFFSYRWLCTRYFLQVKCISCMVRNIS